MEGISHRGISQGGNQSWRESVMEESVIEEISEGGNQLWRESVIDDSVRERISHEEKQSWGIQS